MIKINGVWYLNSLPLHAVVELENGSLTKFLITPFRELGNKDFTDYKGYHPRKCKGQQLPNYLYKFYGLEKNNESLTEVIHVRLTPTEKSKIETYGQNLDPKLSSSEIVRKFISDL